MAKTKLHKLHKIKIHHNRWLIWAIAYTLFVTIALVGYLKVSDLNIDSENTAESTFQSSHSYKDERLGFGLRYPADWSIEADSDSSIVFLPSETSDQGVTVSVLPTSVEQSIRKSLKIASEEIITLDQEPAVKVINDLGQGHSETVIFSVFNRELYVIRGSDGFVQRLLLTFHFVE